MIGAAQHLGALRERLATNFGAEGATVLAQPLAELEALVHADELDPAVAAALLDQLEDLVEALLHGAGWAEVEEGRP